MQDDERARRDGRWRRLTRYGLTGLVLGAGVGYIAALVLPRRHPHAETGYQAPSPARLVPPQRAELPRERAGAAPIAAGTSSARR